MKTAVPNSSSYAALNTAVLLARAFACCFCTWLRLWECGLYHVSYLIYSHRISRFGLVRDTFQRIVLPSKVALVLVWGFLGVDISLLLLSSSSSDPGLTLALVGAYFFLKWSKTQDIHVRKKYPRLNALGMSLQRHLPL